MDGIPYIQHCLGVPWQTILAVIQFTTWYYPVGMYRNALVTHSLNERAGLMFLLIWSYMLFSSTFSQMIVTIMPRRRYWNKYLRIILLPVSDILRVGSRRGFPPSYISNLPTDNLS